MKFASLLQIDIFPLARALSKEYVSEILTLAEKYDIRKNLILHPLVDRRELVKFYNAADIGVWLGKPSITIIEAMASGLPIVIARSEQTCHLLVENGFSFSKGNPHEFENCLERLIQDGKSRRYMGLRSRELVEEKLSWNVITRRTLELYEEILLG